MHVSCMSHACLMHVSCLMCMHEGRGREGRRELRKEGSVRRLDHSEYSIITHRARLQSRSLPAICGKDAHHQAMFHGHPAWGLRGAAKRGEPDDLRRLRPDVGLSSLRVAPEQDEQGSMELPCLRVLLELRMADVGEAQPTTPVVQDMHAGDGL